MHASEPRTSGADPERRLLPATVVFGVPAREHDAYLVDANRERARLALAAPAPEELIPGTGLTVRLEGERNLELIGVVRARAGVELELDLSRAGHREDRWSPREKGRLRFRYLPAPAGFDAEAWALGEPSPPGAWTEPDPRVELSLGGLAYLDPNPPEGRLLLAFVHDDASRRVVAEVVRTDPTRRPGVRRVSLRFVKTPETSGAALADILLALQDAALERFTAPCTLDLPPPGAAVADTSEW
jgi:hypothetical protein